MRMLLLVVSIALAGASSSQSIKQKLSAAFNVMEADPQCRHGIIGLSIVDSKTGTTIFSKNAGIGLAPASCQKIITSVTAFEILGKHFTYTTTLGYDGELEKGLLSGDIIITGSGDPTLGSWRFKNTGESILIDTFTKAIKAAGINGLTGEILTGSHHWDTQTIPGGWIWEDIGNYYGAGVSTLNWRENQYDLILQSGKKIGDPVKIVSTEPGILQGVNLVNELTSARAGTGDNTIIYLAPGSAVGYIRGTIPVNEDHFIVSGSMPDGASQFTSTLYDRLSMATHENKNYGLPTKPKVARTVFFTYSSPSLDRINYWFLKKSINLYGEALVKTIAYENTKYGSTDTGISVIKKFWNLRGVDNTALHIIDGSGLSPANRVTAEALTSVLQYAGKQSWFNSFYNALPEINGIRMKSGSISGVLSYAGFIQSKSGSGYTFSFIINNFNGSPSSLKEKMWKLLNAMK